MTNAGTGKSTIARTVADAFASEKRLVAGYFFKRGEQGRNDTSRLFPTIAMQLFEKIPFLEAQFDKLLWLPLEDLAPFGTDPLPQLIIIDALDECQCPEHLSRILTLFSKLRNSTAARLRVLFTSRSAPEIFSAFEPLLKSKDVRRLRIHQEFSQDTKLDIRVFLTTRFADIKTKRKVQQNPWPAAEDLDRLVQLATTPEPLFIYAATLCRFVYDEHRPRNPNNQLKLWLKQYDGNKSQLHQIYDPILGQVFHGMDEAEHKQQLLFLGALALLATPLSAESLVCLLSIDIDDVNWWLQELHGVLEIPDEPHRPIRLLHRSFSDFLLRPEDSEASKYRIDAEETHAMLAAKCIERMETGLKRDICGLQKPDTSIDEINKQDIEIHIPIDLQYACLYWVHHLQRSKQTMKGQVSKFLNEHFLHWLEVLSLLERLPTEAVAMTQLFETSQVSKAVPVLYKI
ncbi:hypothetical protein ACHAQH_003648 [Verticillium albo-atrum]